MTGATGFIGRVVVPALLGRGHTVVALTRGASALPETPGLEIVQGDPMHRGAWQDVAADCDAALTLAGEHVADTRWSESQKGLIRSSRVQSTQNVVDAFRRAPRPRVLLVCSSTHVYGPRPFREVLDDASCSGHSFLAQVFHEVERVAALARTDGARVVELRIGLVVGSGSGLSYMSLMARGFLGHILGAGSEGFPWVHADDVAGLVLLALEDAAIDSPLNVVGPEVVTWAQAFRAVGRALGRPFLVPVPQVVASAFFGGGAELWFAGQHVVPALATRRGYVFRHATFDGAVAAALS